MKKIGGALAALVLSSSAMAQHWYGQGGPTTLHGSFDCTGQASCSSSGGGWRGRFGYRNVEGWAVEGGVVIHGNFDHKESALAEHKDLSAAGVSLGVAHHTELAADWLLVWRLGATALRGKTDETWTSTAAKTSTKISPYAGAGIGYRFSKRVSLHANLELDRMPVRYRNGASETATVSSFGLALGINY